jgi:hypothetical protein
MFDWNPKEKRRKNLSLSYLRFIGGPINFVPTWRITSIADSLVTSSTITTINAREGENDTSCSLYKKTGRWLASVRLRGKSFCHDKVWFGERKRERESRDLWSTCAYLLDRCTLWTHLLFCRHVVGYDMGTAVVEIDWKGSNLSLFYFCCLKEIWILTMIT